MSEVRITRDIEYARRGELSLTFDLYAPAAGGAFPALVFVHGGGWQGGDKSSAVVWGEYLAQRGIGVMAVKYRIARKGVKAWPDAADDVRAAVDYVRDNAASLGADSARIGLFGGSAGAQLAAVAALAPGATGGLSPVKLVVSAYGVYDMFAQWERELLVRPRNNLVETFLGAAPMDDRRVYFEASPLSYATSSNRRVKFLLTWGLQDDVVDPAQSQNFMRALEQAGFFARSFILPEAGHYWLSDPIEDPHGFSGRFAPGMLRFLKTWL